MKHSPKKFDLYEWIEPSTAGIYSLNDRSLDLGVNRFQMSNRGKYRFHIERGAGDGIQLCGRESDDYWDYEAALTESELNQICPKCLAELKRRAMGGTY